MCRKNLKLRLNFCSQKKQELWSQEKCCAENFKQFTKKEHKLTKEIKYGTATQLEQSSPILFMGSLGSYDSGSHSLVF